MAPQVRVGIVGWNYPEWRGIVYGPKTKPPEFLKEYATRYPIVEAASSYYGMPKTETVEGWAQAVPPGFEISLKVPDWILKKDPEDPDLARSLGVLMEHLAPLKTSGNLGTLVAQFAPTFTHEKRAGHLATFLGALPEGPRWAVELRHESWWRDDVYDLLRQKGVALVWSELADGFRTPPVATTDSLYLRLFGDRELEPPYANKRRDAKDTLAVWVDRIGKLPEGIRRVDVLVSKYLEGHAPETVKTLTDMLGLKPNRPTRGQTTLM